MAELKSLQVELTAFNKLEILRHELEERKRELVDTEVKIRDMLSLMETQRYLESLSPYYAANPVEGMPTREAIQGLEQKRAQLADLIENIEKTIPVMLEATKNAPQQSSQSNSDAAARIFGGARKVKFDDFS